MRPFTKIGALVLFIALLSQNTGCTSMRNFGEGVCATQEEISSGITELAGFAGPPGMVVARVLNLALSTGCKVFAGVVAMPSDVTNDVTGMFTDEPVEEDPGN